MVKSMYQHITTRILTGKADSELDPEEIEALYYDVNTGVREGSTLSPLLYILFIDGLLDELRKRKLGVLIRNKSTALKTWVGGLMYADDLALVAKGPGELQLMMDVVTEYAKKWRFEINPKTDKTSVLAFMETKQQKRERIASFGQTWMCGGNRIYEEPHYVYLGVHLTTDLNPHTHLNQLKHKVASQKREAILIGVRAGVLSMRRAVFLWKQWVEPKYAYACALWIRADDAKAMGMIDRIQCEGAEAILGLNTQRQDQTPPPRCNLLNEAHLLPATALHAAGLLRFYRLVLSRRSDSLLKRVWNCVESHSRQATGIHWTRSTNYAIKRLVNAYPVLQDRARLPPPSDRIQWKHLTNDIARTEMRAWTRQQRTRAGRVEAYAQIARELNPHGGVYGQFAQYLLTPGLTRQTRLSIAAMRVQSNAFLATHAGYRETELYGPEQPDYRKRGCIWPPCTHGQKRVPDDAAHVLLDCPHFAAQRRQYLARVNAILASIGFSLDDLQTRARQTSFLLGSLLLPLLQIEEDHPGTYAEVLSETGAFLRHVYSYRWKHRHQRG